MLDDMDDRSDTPRRKPHRTKNRARIRVPGIAPSAVFDMVCDLDQLADWNTAITHVVSRPHSLEPGAEWKVAMRDGPLRWISRSTVVEHDPESMVFAFRSGTDDGNPSYAEWRWSATTDGDGTILEVSWRLCPRTALRRWLLAPYRARRLRREVPMSLAELARHITASHRPAETAGRTT